MLTTLQSVTDEKTKAAQESQSHIVSECLGKNKPKETAQKHLPNFYQNFLYYIHFSAQHLSSTSLEMSLRKRSSPDTYLKER